MLKDITLGQYYPDDSFVHRLDPRTKLIAVLIYIVALFVAVNVLSYLAVFLLLLAAIPLSHVRLTAILKSVKPLLIIIIFTAVLNLFFTRGETPLITVWKIRIYAEGVRTAVFMVLRIVLLIAGTFLLTYSTSPLELTDGMESLMRPLKKLRVPVHELSLMMSIALRFIPTLIKETEKIMNAQKARGADFESGNLVQKAKALLPLLVPLFVSAFRRADELAVAMESRCYHGDEGRTKMKQLKFQKADGVTLAVCVCLLAGVTALAVGGL